MAVNRAVLRDQIKDVLLQRILDGHYSPGQRIVETRVAEEFGVSQAPVREALRELESEGLISTIPNRGPLVSTLSAREAASIYEVRGVLEGLAAKLFAEKATDEQIAELSASVDRLEAVYATADVERILVAKKAFYDVLLEGSQNVVIPSILRTMNARVTQLRRVSLSSPKRLPDSLREIRAVLKAIRDRDPEAAFQASLQHIAEASKVAMEKLKD